MTDRAYPQPAWRVPKQARSRERFNRILDVAAQLFAESGYDGVTTDAIAAQADTSVGGLYRFFPDKLAVFQAVVDRYLTQLRDAFTALHSAETVQLPIDLYLNLVVDGFDQFVAANPPFRAIFIQSRFVSPEFLAMDSAFNREISQQLSAFFALKNPHLTPEKRDLLATVSVEVASTLEILALSRDAAFQKQILDETKTVLFAYLKPYF